jgi:hypothetical protein
MKFSVVFVISATDNINYVVVVFLSGSTQKIDLTALFASTCVA